MTKFVYRMQNILDLKIKLEDQAKIFFSQANAKLREEEARLYQIQGQIQEYKEYLRETDYVVIKMYEIVAQGGSIIEMLKEYKEVLSKRKEARKLINELEKKVGETNGN